MRIRKTPTLPDEQIFIITYAGKIHSAWSSLTEANRQSLIISELTGLPYTVQSVPYNRAI